MMYVFFLSLLPLGMAALAGGERLSTRMDQRQGAEAGTETLSGGLVAALAAVGGALLVAALRLL